MYVYIYIYMLYSNIYIYIYMIIYPFTRKAAPVERYSIGIHCKTQGSATKVSKPGSVAIDHRRTALMGHCPHVARRKKRGLASSPKFSPEGHMSQPGRRKS